MTNASYREHGSGSDLLLTAEDMEWFWNYYVPEPAARSAPGHHEDMFHDFFSFVNLIEAGNEAVERIGGEIRTLVATLTTRA